MDRSFHLSYAKLYECEAKREHGWIEISQRDYCSVLTMLFLLEEAGVRDI